MNFSCNGRYTSGAHISSSAWNSITNHVDDFTIFFDCTEFTICQNILNCSKMTRLVFDNLRNQYTLYRISSDLLLIVVENNRNVQPTSFSLNCFIFSCRVVSNFLHCWSFIVSNSWEFDNSCKDKVIPTIIQTNKKPLVMSSPQRL